MQLTKEDIDFIEASRGHYNTIVQAGYMNNLGQDTKMRMNEIIKKYFAPAYLANLWCGPCIMDMVKYLYTQYDALPKPVIKHETFPKHDEPEMYLKEESKVVFITETPEPELGTKAAEQPKKRGRKKKGAE